MRLATRILATSLALLLSATAFGAELAKPAACASIGDEHREAGFHLAGSKWRAIITNPFEKKPEDQQTCDQFLFTVNGTKIDIQSQATEILPNPKTQQCNWAAAHHKVTHEVHLSGRIDMYCFDKGGGPRRYGELVIWNAKDNTTPYGALYGLSGTPGENGQHEWYGYGSDGEYGGIQITLVPAQ